MSDKHPDGQKSKRQERLEAALRQNLRRRKEQARARQAADVPETEDGDGQGADRQDGVGQFDRERREEG